MQGGRARRVDGIVSLHRERRRFENYGRFDRGRSRVTLDAAVDAADEHSIHIATLRSDD